MFNPEKLLGGLLMGGSRRRSGMGSLVSSGVALGLVGVAVEAVEHFMDKSKTPASAPPPEGDRQPVLMIRAMIAAANADGVMDETERNRILKYGIVFITGLFI
jgi:uncharacterized membrane protein YebE (DUF533 family)